MNPTGWRWLRDGQHGSAAVEIVLLGPLLAGALLLVLLSIRLTDTQVHLDDTARAAARAATLARDPAQARLDIQATVHATFTDDRVRCAPLSVDTDLGGFQPGSPVHVRLSCRVLLQDLTLLGIPGSVTVTARATSPLDRWRATSAPIRP